MSPKMKTQNILRDLNENLPTAYTFVAPDTRGAIATQSPRVVFIEVTNHCNLLCETCPRTFTSYENPQTLSWDNFLRIVEQFPEMQRAVLHGIGEPLMNRDLARMVEFLKARNVTVLFNTNATLLTDDWARLLIASGLDEMRVSMDAANPQTYAKIRGAPLFDKIVQNLQHFTEIQRALNANTLRTSIWMTGMRDLVRLAARVGVREVYLQRMVYYLDNSAPPGMMGQGHGLVDDFDSLVDNMLADAEKTARELGVTLRASGATDPRRSLDQSREHTTRPWAECLRPWSTAYVTANGNCLPCCISPFATQDYESLKMGNLFQQSFAEIWNADKYRAWRKNLLSDAPSAACRGCGVHWSL
jgi:radical SAM protein with 4Fe4S-binding SPASM domain